VAALALWLFWLPELLEPSDEDELLPMLEFEPVVLEPIEPEPDDDDALPALLVPPTAPVLDAVAPPVLLPVVELCWSLPWFCWLLLFRLPEPVVLPMLPEPAAFGRLLSLPWLPRLLPFASLDF
jgi:hypothetical protein